MVLSIYLVFLIFSSIFSIQTYGERRFEILLTSFNCTVNPTYAKVTYCYTNKTYNPPRTFMEIRIQREIPVAKYSWVFYLVHPKTHKRRRLLYVKNMNYCEFIEGVSSIPFLKILRNIALQHGTLPTKCPIKKDSIIAFNDVVLNSEKFPPFMIETNYIAILNITSGKNFIYALAADGKVLPKY